MKLTAMDINNKEFKRGLRGYSVEEVDEFLDQVVENYEEAENRYYFSEDNRESLPEVMDKTFTEDQLKEIYRDIIDETEYHDFQEWFSDMLKSGLILHI